MPERARGLVSSRVSGARVDAGRQPPPADLADVVETFWSGRWDLRGQAPHHTELLSDPCMHIVFERGDGQVGARIVGVWTDLWRRTLAGTGFVRGVKLRSGAGTAFVDRPAAELANRIVALAELVPAADVDAVERAVMEPDDDARAFDAFATWLRARRRPDDRARRLAVELVERIASGGDIATVAQLARVAGVGVRAIQQAFRAHVGAAPKWVIRRHRLQEAAGRLERGEAPNITALAADLGYTDHAHLARDFRAAVGKTPSEFADAVHR